MAAGWRIASVAAACAALACGCDSGGSGLGGLFGPSAGGTGSGGSAGASGANAPSDATMFTILLRYFDDPLAHAADAAYYQKALTERLHWKGVFVVNRAGRSDLFWGKYRSVEDAADNLRTARSHRAQDGSVVFDRPMVVPVPTGDIGPPEWSLRNARFPYTVLIATFQDLPDLKDSLGRRRPYVGRKKFAVDYCKQLRDKRYDAYYHHGPVMSVVTLGAFDASAVTVKRLPDGAEQFVINDARINALQQEFPFLQVNGSGVEDIRRDAGGKEHRTPVRTYLMRVPRDEGGNE